MVVKALMPVEEYLNSSFPGPEPDFIEGEVVERSVPNTFHSSTQGDLFEVFRPWKQRGDLFPYSEIRLRLRARKFRVADFAVFRNKQREAIPEDVPLCVVEIVSPNDLYEDLTDKLADYEAAGVEFLFVADPPKRKLLRYRNGDLVSVQSLEMAQFGVVVSLQDVFASL